MNETTNPIATRLVMVHRHLAAVLVKIIGERADHGRDRQEKGKLRRRALVRLSSIAATMLAPERDTPGIIARQLRDADPKIRQQRELVASCSCGLRSS